MAMLVAINRVVLPDDHLKVGKLFWPIGLRAETILEFFAALIQRGESIAVCLTPTDRLATLGDARHALFQ